MALGSAMKGAVGVLFPVAPDKYGNDYGRDLLEQYKLYVQSAQALSERRTSANNYLLSVNTAFVSVYGFLSTLQPAQGWKVVMTVAGIVVCFLWAALITSYRTLNSAKFE